MNLHRKYSLYRKIAVFVAINFLVQILTPTALWALTGGPSSPEFSSFEPVATTNMVNEFTGDLTYNLPVINVPGVNGGGYAMSLSYHSGTTPEEEASWVGYGWTLNPGAINRGKKGFPDDWNNTSVKYWNKTPANETVALGGSLGNLEVFSYDFPASVNSSIRYNNYKGFGYTIGAGLSLAKGVVSLGYNISDGNGSFSLALNPAAAMNLGKEKGEKVAKKDREAAIAKAKTKKKDAIKRLKDAKKNKMSSATELQDKIDAGSRKRGALEGLGSGYGLHNFASESRPTQIVGYTGISTTLSLGLMVTPGPVQIGPSGGLFGSYSRQENISENYLSTYGYMYSADAGSDDMMDYFVEKGSTYTKQDKFLGIPFNNADNYALTGEGLGGGFKLYNRNAGQFHPNYIKSSINIFNVGAEFEAGLNWGGGADVGVGHQSLEISEWHPPSSNNGFSKNEDESVFFRFANDKGGYVSYDGGNTEAKQANVQFTNGIIGAKSAIPNTAHISKSLGSNNGYSRALRSSYIGYNTNGDINATHGGVNYRAYTKDAEAHISNGTINRADQNQIGEFSITNEDGNTYNYGLPVLSKEEKNLQVDLNGVSASSIQNRFLVYRDITGSTETKVGEERATHYTTSYLLTEITSPDYIDRANDGPTDDDFGGYTKFIYNKFYGTGITDADANPDEDWYKWRMPYAGLSYNRNELSNPKDDLGSVAEGYKEVYYLDTIETKTHYAIFHVSDREDGLDAAHNEATASTTSTAKGTFKLKKLDKIQLFAKNHSGGSDQLIKTVHFKYDYSLCDGVLNNGNGSGKLTLKKVWFEYNGAVDAKISPYQFEYEYPTVAQANYPARYNTYENYGGFSAAEQNPNYSPFNIDAWGNYQYDGAARYENMMPWLDQSGTNAVDFDPAAWQLKVIKLPSGGEIHIQYEQDDYCYVQDQAVQAMVSLSGGNHSTGKFYINAADLGITSVFEKQQLTALINKQHVTGGKKMYFKMLYKLIGNATPNLNDCNVEYVTGYADVQSVTYNAISGNIEVQLNQFGYSLPQQVCEDYVTTQRAGNLSFVGSNCDPTQNNAINGGDATDKILSFVGQAAAWVGSLVPGTTCLEVNYPYSYLKIPLLDAKKGGGVRVKRLLMYDKGIDTGTPVLYGSEYIYKTYDEERKQYRSSGVATNEPSSIREENALVGFMDRFKQSFFNKVVSGRDKKQSEGPLGESLLPNPSVGYSKIITKSIHSGKTNPGFAIKEYYTAKDYPIKIGMSEDDNSDVMTTMDRDNKDYLPIITGLVNKITNNLWVSQGYAFEINNMHGQMRSSSTYAGDYSDILNPNASTLVSQEILTYFEPGEELPILDPTDLSYDTTMPLGREMDMVSESKAVKDINIDGNVEFDADAGLFGIIVFPFLTAFPTMNYTETELYTHTTTKIINYPAIVKSSKSYADGIYHITENVAFNPETGQPIMTKTTDGFDDLNLLASNNHDGDYTNYKFPGSLAYENVSQKAKNERKTVATTASVTIDKVVQNDQAYLSFAATPPATVCDAMSNFVGGDLIKLSDGVYHTGSVYGSKIEILPTYYSSLGSDLSGINVEIIRSGRTNQLNLNVGSVTTYGKDSVIITPVDSATLAIRQQFADMLTAALEQDTIYLDTIFPDSIPSGIEFINPDGSCTPLDSNYFILVEGNAVNIYGPGIPINQDTIIVGTPGNPHDMVDTLNHYLNYFHDYDLDTTGGYDQLCGTLSLNYNTVFEIGNSSYSTMKNEQDTILSLEFTGVNGGTHSIDEYLQRTDPDVGVTYATVEIVTPRLINKFVILQEIASSNKYGASISCSETALFCQGCVLDEEDYGRCGRGDFHDDLGEFIQTQDGYLAYQTILAEAGSPTYNCLTDIRFYKLEGGDVFPELLCSSELEMSGDYGSFEIDPKTASLVYYAGDNPCYAQDVPCLRFCSEKYPSTAITNVVASEANTLNDNWDYNETSYAATGNNYEMGKKGKWRLESSYAFKTDIDRLTSSPTPYDKNYNSGTYNLELFNWEILNANGPKWLELNKVNSYSPNGNALEEENILGIKSAAKFGYSNTLPYLIAQNSDNTSVMFESFENTYAGGTALEDGITLNPLDGSVVSNVSHSGNNSFKLTFPANDGVEMTEMMVTNQMLAKGVLFKVWIKTDFNDRSILDNHLKAQLEDVVNNATISQSFNKVAQAGDWYLYEARILPSQFSGFSSGNTMKTFVKYEFTAHGSENVWIDDVRIQPMDAQVTAYVYDVVSHRLITSFDDQHFGLFYQYNAEGKLVRKLIETERGIKTIQETQYHIPKINR